MKIAWFSNAPWFPTGYGTQTALVVPRIRDLGHEVTLIANCGVEGSCLAWDGMQIYPKCPHGDPTKYLQYVASRIKPDIFITLYCAWMLKAKMFQPRWVPWTMIDREPQPDMVLEQIKESFLPISCSKFGERICDKNKIDNAYVPLAVDTKVFKSRMRSDARAAIGLPPDPFIIGVVADNKGYPNRKAIPQEIQAFAKFHAEHPNSMMFLHTCADQGRGSFDLIPLIKHLGIEDAVKFSDQDMYKLGMEKEYLVNGYNAMDVLVNVSMDEGFGLTLLEAQACGTPVIAGDWTAMPDIVFGGITISKDEAEPFWNPTGGYQYMPHVDAIHKAYEKMYRSRAAGPDYARRTRAGALDYDIDVVMEKYWTPCLDRLERMVAETPTFEKAITE